MACRDVIRHTFEFETVKSHRKFWQNSSKSADGQFGIDIGKWQA